MEGTPFGRYRLVELLGRGGMGEVWKAFDTETRRTVALKLLPAAVAGDEVFEARFRREAEAAAGLNDPHVVPIHHFGEIDGRLYVDMRLIEGYDVDVVLRQGPLDPLRAVVIVEQIAAALAAAHAVGLVHRDVKPSNILLARDDFAYLIDFGIAHAAGDTSLTSTGTTLGTWAYMAPERFRGGLVGPSVDVYALTCVLFQCLTGQAPFPGGTLEQVAMGHMTTEPPKPSTYQSTISSAMDHVIALGMAKDPADRYQTTKELAWAARAAVEMLSNDATATRPAEAFHQPDARGTPTQETASATRQAPNAPAPTENRPPTPNVRRPRTLTVAVALALLCAALIAAQVVYDVVLYVSHGAKHSSPAYVAGLVNGNVVIAAFLAWAAILAWRGSSRRPLRFTPLAFLLVGVVIGALSVMDRGLVKSAGVIAVSVTELFVFAVPISLLLATRSSEDFFKARGEIEASSVSPSARRRPWRSVLPIIGPLLVIVVAIPVAVSHIANRPFWATPPDYSASLLNVNEIDTLVGTTGLAITSTGEEPDDASVITPPECDAPTHSSGIQAYGSSGFATMQWQGMINPSRTYLVNQGLTKFDSPEIASDFVSKLARHFEVCQRKTFELKVRASGAESQGIVDAVTTGSTVLSAIYHYVGSSGTCQHVVQVASSFVIEAKVCGANIDDMAVRLASAIAARTEHG